MDGTLTQDGCLQVWMWNIYVQLHHQRKTVGIDKKTEQIDMKENRKILQAVLFVRKPTDTTVETFPIEVLRYD